MPDVHMPLKKHILTYAMHLYMYIYVYFHFHLFIPGLKLVFVRNLSNWNLSGILVGWYKCSLGLEGGGPN